MAAAAEPSRRGVADAGDRNRAAAGGCSGLLGATRPPPAPGTGQVLVQRGGLSRATAAGTSRSTARR